MAVALRKHLPPTNALVVFEAAGRHMNFTRAAKELDVTQSAVSRQIQLLEEFLGFSVFQRQSRGLSLTAVAAELEMRHANRMASAKAAESAATARAMAAHRNDFEYAVQQAAEYVELQLTTRDAGARVALRDYLTMLDRSWRTKS